MALKARHHSRTPRKTPPPIRLSANCNQLQIPGTDSWPQQVQKAEGQQGITAMVHRPSQRLDGECSHRAETRHSHRAQGICDASSFILGRTAVGSPRVPTNG